MDDVVLQIEAALGVANQFGAGSEGFTAVGQQAKSGFALMGRRLSLDRATKRRVAGRQRLARFALNVEAGATAKQGSEKEKRKQGQSGSHVGLFRLAAVVGIGRRFPEKGQSVQLSVSASSLIAAAPTRRTASSICGVGLAA
ncbi:hypothetical protein D3C86_1726720 [compost metagenome]